MKKAICLLLAVLLLASSLAGCGNKQAESAFTARNEIVTYDTVDPKKTQLVVSRTGNIEVHTLCQEFEDRNPDVQIVYIDITGGNSGCKPLIAWIENGYAPDVVISGADFFNDELTVKYFENLSANPILDNYEAAALNRTATQSDVYWLPGPSNVSAMMYNKTLFERYGWSVPSTFDEFVALCIKIREDTNGEVEPWNPNAKYDQELQAVMEGFVYEEVFGGVENRTWYNDLIRGEADFMPHMEPYYDALQTLVENGLLREEHFTYSATARGNEFVAGKIAMININIYEADNDEFDFGYMPFPGTKGNLGYVLDSYSCFVGVPKKERSDKERDALNRFIEFFSSSDGQNIYIGNSMKVSNVKNVPLNQSNDLAALQPAIDEGHMFAMLNFVSEQGERSRISLYQPALNMASGNKTRDECVSDASSTELYAKSAAAAAEEESVAAAQSDMTILETSFYIADAYREAAGAEIGLIANNEAYRGNLMRVFKGELTPAFVTVLKPRSFANGSALIKARMTGAQLLDALNNPPHNDGISNCVYAFSGLKCEVAPWRELGKKYISVKLENGDAIEPDKSYAVAFWEGTVDEAYIAEVLERFEVSFEEILTTKMKADGTVAPANDARITLVWN